MTTFSTPNLHLENDCIENAECLQELRNRNLEPKPYRLDTAQLRELSSDMKRSAIFLRRIAEFKSSSLPVVIRDVQQLNLSRYLTEAAGNIISTVLEGKTKSSDVPSLALVCGEMHQRYGSFTPALLGDLKKRWTLSFFLAPRKEAEDVTRSRILTRLCCALFRYGVITEWKLFRWVISQLQRSYLSREALKTLQNSENNPELIPPSGIVTLALSVVQIIVKSIGCHLYGAKQWQEISESGEERNKTASFDDIVSRAEPSLELYVSQASAEEFKELVKNVSQFCTDILDEVYSEMKALWKENLEVIRRTGELPETLCEQFGTQKKIADKLYQLLHPIVVTHPNGELIPLQSPPTLASLQDDLKSSQKDSANTSDIVLLSGLSAFYSVGEISWSSDKLFETEDEEAFYHNVASIAIPIDEALGAPRAASLTDTDVEVEEQEAVLSVTQDLGLLYHVLSSEAMDLVKVSHSAETWLSTFLSPSHALNRYRTRHSKDQGRSFLLSCKKKLIRSISEMPFEHKASAPGLLRIAAMLQASSEPILTDLGEICFKQCEEGLMKMVDQSAFSDLGPKHALVTLLCEATKFQLGSSASLLRLLSYCGDIAQLKGRSHNGESLLLFLQSVGPYLTRNAVTRPKFESLLRSFVKSIRVLGGELELRLGTAISTCKSIIEDQTAAQEKALLNVPKTTRKDTDKPMLERYFRHLLFVELSSDNVSFVSKQIRKLDCSKPENLQMLQRVMRKTARMRDTGIEDLTNVLHILWKNDKMWRTHTHLLIDDIVERLRQDLENEFFSSPHPVRAIQKRIHDIRFLGEFASRRMLTDGTLFYVLYMVTLYGMEQDTPHGGYARARLVLTLLHALTLSRFKTRFTDPLFRSRLFYYLFYFFRNMQRLPKPLPVALGFLFAEVHEGLSKQSPAGFNLVSAFPATLKEANENLDRVMKELDRAAAETRNSGKKNSKSSKAHAFTLSSFSRKAGMTKSRVQEASQDPVNDYVYYFALSHAEMDKALHPIEDDRFLQQVEVQDSLEESTEEEELTTEEEMKRLNVSKEEKTTARDESQSKDAEIDAENEFENEKWDEEENATHANQPLSNPKEEEEMDRLLRETAKESFDAIKLQNTLKSMGGRRLGPTPLAGRTSLLRSSHENKESLSHEKGEDHAKEKDLLLSSKNTEKKIHTQQTVSLGVAIRKKRVGGGATEGSSKSSYGVGYEIRHVEVPVTHTLVEAQQAQLAQRKKEEMEYRKATQQRLEELSREEMLS